jgi:error-prone DNA polymerase
VGFERFTSMDALVTCAGLRQDEMRTLAEVGALASFGGDRRTALWQAERAGRPAGPLLMDEDEASGLWPRGHGPLRPMSLSERVRADYDGTGLTIGPHPMALVRASLAARAVARAGDLARGRAGRRVRVAGAVITRQRPGTAKGFVFLSLEDETGIANIIVTPDVFALYKRTIVDEPYLIVEGTLQNQDGAVSVKADRIDALRHDGPQTDARNFY